MWIVRAKSRRSARVEWLEYPDRDTATAMAGMYDRRRWDVTLIYGQDCGQI